jgi:signal transduction histidine kinase/ligand-binding sensor domain-containing protein
MALETGVAQIMSGGSAIHSREPEFRRRRSRRNPFGAAKCGPAHPGRKSHGRLLDVVIFFRGFFRFSTRILDCSKIVFLAMSATATVAFALNPDRTVAQFYHTAWTIEDGVPGRIEMLAQTRDGYLWLGTFRGLFRFDGVRFERYRPERGDPFPSQDIFSLLATPDGGLWIGFRAGGATFLENGRGHSYGEREGLPASTVNRFALDREGAIWAGTTHGLFRFTNSRWEKIGKEWGFFAEQAGNLFVDNQGKLWLNGNTDLYCLPQGAHIFQMRKLPYRWVIRQTADGVFWLLEETKGVRAVSGPLAEIYDGSKGALRFSIGTQLLVDRDGSFWMSVAEQGGVRRVSKPAQLLSRTVESTSGLIQKFTHQDGLSSDGVRDMLEDYEGDILIATAAGLDRFRRKNVVQGPFPPPTTPYSPLVVADRDGVIWEGSGGSLLAAASDGVSVREGPQFAQPTGLLGSLAAMTCGWRDFEGAVWLGGKGTLARWANGRIENFDFPDKDLAAGHWDVQAITRRRAGDLWVSIQEHGVYRRHDGRWAQYGMLPGLPKSTAVILWTDSTDRVWFGYMGNQIALVDGERVRTFSSADGLHVGNVLAIGGRGDHIWAAGQFGLALFDGNQFHTIAGEVDSAFRGVSGVVESPTGDLWLNQETGVARIPAAEITNRLRDSKQKLQYDLLDFRDGVKGTATQLRPLPSAVEAGDGRIWFSGSDGVYWVDPARIYKNPAPPPVTIEAVYEGDQRFSTFDPSRLPRLPQNVRIEYTALSLSIPERIRFRYQLEGYDKGWQDVGTRRAAYYPKLPPGHFRFHVIAANNDGVWNQTGAVAEIVVPPAFYQTGWFEASCAFAGLALLWGLYRYRLHQIAREFSVRLDERLGERMRIARALHDTLLQSFQGLMLRFQVAHDELPDRPAEARKALEHALDEAAQAITEGRDAVQGLRMSQVETDNLAQAIGSLGEELAGDESNSNRVESSVEVEGTPRDIHPILRDEIYRIAGEALRNAFRHAQARRINVAIGYGERQFRLRVRDDGTGIDPEVLDQQGRAGHWGLAGMRERAELIGGELEIWSRRESGTQVELSIPASIIYTTSTARRFRSMARKGGAKA